MCDTVHNSAERLELCKFTESAYLNYSMYVIINRALPFIGDGLKPVQRRIVYAMSELGLNASAKHKKSARTIGDVLGKYHPHGDNACYEAMVLMAQPFSYRYPMIDGQGNWGAPGDPKSFAAMRYTESRLSQYTELFLSELDQGTVDYVPNFDGTLEEPKMLPVRLPNVLLNGTTGIAVGMATDIPPHNLKEIAAAIVTLLKNPDTTLAQLLEHIKGPDFPTKAEIITSKDDLHKMYQTGRGSVRIRARWKIENDEAVISALPYQVTSTKVLEQIANQMRTKKQPLLEDLRDESDHTNPIRLVIVPRSNRVDMMEIMNNLFSTTDLERSYRINMNMIGLNGRPEVKNLHTILTEWLLYRRNTVRKRLNFQLEKVIHRLHILIGLLVVYRNMNSVIQILRTEDKQKTVLMRRFNLSDTQVDAIMELKLRHVAKLDERHILKEQKSLQKKRDQLKSILTSEHKFNNLLKKEIEVDAVIYGNARCSPLVESGKAPVINENNLVSEPVTVILSTMGWVRSAKGHDINASALSYRSGDYYRSSVRGKSNQPVVFLDSTGRSYALEPANLPSVRGQGEPLTGKFTLPPRAMIEQMLTAKAEQKLLIASDNGYGFICSFSELVARHRAGKALLTLPEHSKFMPPLWLEKTDDNLLVISKNGRLLILPVNNLPHFSKGKGKKIIYIPALETDRLIGLYLLSSKASVIFHVGKRKLTLLPEELQTLIVKKGRKGTLLPCGFHRIDRVEIKSPLDSDNLG